ALPDDIDVFTSGGGGGNRDRPNVLIILDNTSNWARQSQQWPGGLQQGQSEARGIKTALGSVGDDLNVGLMVFDTASNANIEGGYVRQNIVQMTTANKAIFHVTLDDIYNNVNSPDEQR